MSYIHILIKLNCNKIDKLKKTALGVDLIYYWEFNSWSCVFKMYAKNYESYN